MIKNYTEGGLKMISVCNFMIALKSTWIRRILRSNAKWKVVIESQLNTQKLANCGQIYIDICLNNVTNNFWKDVFIAFKSVSSKIEDKEINFLEIPLWHNPDITIDGRSIFYENWFAKGIMYIGDLVNED